MAGVDEDDELEEEADDDEVEVEVDDESDEDVAEVVESAFFDSAPFDFSGLTPPERESLR